MADPRSYEMVSSKGKPEETSGQTNAQAKDTIQGAYGHNKSVINPALSVARGTGSDTTAMDSIASRAVNTADEYARGQADYDMTPEKAWDRYNVAGTTGQERNRYSRLVDALNARKWGTTTAAGRYNALTGATENTGGNRWVDMSIPGVQTAESRGQRRAEDYEAMSAGSAIARDDMLKRMAPELEKVRNTLKMNFADRLDSKQLDAIDKELNLMQSQAFLQFSNEEQVQQILRLSSTLVGLPSDTQRMVIGLLQGTALPSAMQMQLNTASQQALDSFYRTNDNFYLQEYKALIGLSAVPERMGAQVGARSAVTDTVGAANAMKDEMKSGGKKN